MEFAPAMVSGRWVALVVAKAAAFARTPHASGTMGQVSPALGTAGAPIATWHASTEFAARGQRGVQFSIAICTRASTSSVNSAGWPTIVNTRQVPACRSDSRWLSDDQAAVAPSTAVAVGGVANHKRRAHLPRGCASAIRASVCHNLNGTCTCDQGVRLACR